MVLACEEVRSLCADCTVGGAPDDIAHGGCEVLCSLTKRREDERCDYHSLAGHVVSLQTSWKRRSSWLRRWIA